MKKTKKTKEKMIHHLHHHIHHHHLDLIPLNLPHLIKVSLKNNLKITEHIKMTHLHLIVAKIKEKKWNEKNDSSSEENNYSDEDNNKFLNKIKVFKKDIPHT